MVYYIKSNKKELYWNVVSEKEMREMLETARKNYKKAVNSMNISKYQKDYFLNEKVRGMLAEFLKDKIKTKNPKVLDVGAGFGALSIALARNFHTTSVDVNPLTLKFLKYRALQEKVNLRLKRIPQLFFGLPFKNNSFDVIILNGVLEWVAYGVKDNPKKIQKKVLREVFRVLKKNGTFVLAIENRFALDWFKGKTSHTGIKYVDLLPRKIANLICQRKKGEKYRTYLYSYFGYKQLLKDAGLTEIKIYEAYPTYQKPEWIRKTKNFFANSYVILGRKLAN